MLWALPLELSHVAMVQSQDEVEKSEVVRRNFSRSQIADQYAMSLRCLNSTNIRRFTNVISVCASRIDAYFFIEPV